MPDPDQEAPLEFVASPEDAGERLDRVLARRLPQYSRARFQAMIEAGLVTIDGSPATETRRKLKPGEMVRAQPGAPVETEVAAQPIALEVVHEDDDVIVIDKPAGLVVHPGAGTPDGTLVNALLAHCGDTLSGIGGVKRPGIVHRLDKDTSGLLVVAKNDRAHHALSKQFAAHGRDGKLRRAYVAIVWGAMPRRHGTIEGSIGRKATNRTKMAVVPDERGREAITHYEVLETFGPPAKPLASLVRLELETGRTHQIRVHMAHAGHPLLGDQTYGQGFKSSEVLLPAPVREALTALDRQALHAAELGFEHPATKEQLHFTSEPPADLARLMESLEPLKTGKKR
ncbi:MAG: RluA family pseudouridine synthase [Hyphomicrobiales bacterium]